MKYNVQSYPIGFVSQQVVVVIITRRNESRKEYSRKIELNQSTVTIISLDNLLNLVLLILFLCNSVLVFAFTRSLIISCAIV